MECSGRHRGDVVGSEHRVSRDDGQPLVLGLRVEYPIEWVPVVWGESAGGERVGEGDGQRLEATAGDNRFQVIGGGQLAKRLLYRDLPSGGG